MSIPTTVYIPAGWLAFNGPRHAPVSSYRCRECGRNAHLDPPEVYWTIIGDAAYCPECKPGTPDHLAAQLDDLASILNGSALVEENPAFQESLAEATRILDAYREAQQ